MSDEKEPEKAHDVDKNDPNYSLKVSDVIKRRFEEEKKKSFEREKAKMDEGRKKPTPAQINPPEVQPSTTAQPPVDQRDPEEYVKRKEIVALVNQLNRSFAIIEKHRLEVEKFMTALKAALTGE